PKKTNSQLRTKSDHEPRGSFGNQKPYAVMMRWDARTVRTSGWRAPQAEPLNLLQLTCCAARFSSSACRYDLNVGTPWRAQDDSIAETTRWFFARNSMNAG